MSIHWNRQDRKKFQDILETTYRDYDDLEIFVDYELDRKLSKIVEKTNMHRVIYKLLERVNAEGKLDELFEKVCEANPGKKDFIIAKLQSQPLINPSFNFPKEDWESLFNTLTTDDSAYVETAFSEAFEAVINRKFRQIYPERSSNIPDEIKNLLRRYDDLRSCT